VTTSGICIRYLSGDILMGQNTSVAVIGTVHENGLQMNRINDLQRFHLLTMA
jgi:hypothetical protein